MSDRASADVLRGRPWIVPLTALTVTGIAYAVAGVLRSRRRRAQRAADLEHERNRVAG
jgi:hypothetical protein